MFQGQQIREIEDVVGHPPADVAVEPRMKRLRGGLFSLPLEQFASLGAIPPPDLPCGDHRPETDPGRSYQSSLPPEKDRGSLSITPRGTSPSSEAVALSWLGV